MSFAELKPETQAIAKRVLTQKQYDVFVLWCAGVGTARIAIMLDVSQSTARDHLNRARQLIEIELHRNKRL